jgi:dihydropyrimidinase
MYGLHPRKGSIAIGSDADIAIWDPRRTVKITSAGLHHGADYTPYEGFEVTGWPVTTIMRGEVVVDHGELVGSIGHGAYVKRARSEYAVPASAQVTA